MRSVIPFILTAAACAFTPDLSAQTFSTAPLRAPAAIPRDGLPKTATAYFAWLEDPASRQQGIESQVLLEHTFALIAAEVRRRFAGSGTSDLPAADSTLGRLYGWAAQQGAHGAELVARRLGWRADPIVRSDPEFTLALDGSNYALMSGQGRWRAVFPWYFMIGDLQRAQLNDGATIDLAMLSTLTAADSSQDAGASQATLLIISTESPDLPRLAATWLGRLGISPDDTIPRIVPNATRSYRTYAKNEGMLKEMTAFRIPSGSLVLIYVGRTGTAESNRDHYLDVARNLQVR